MDTVTTAAATGTDRVPPPARTAGSGRDLARSVGFALVYAAAVALGRSTLLDGSPLALVWPAAGVGVVWLAGSWGRPGWRVVDGGLLAVVTTVGAALTDAPWPVAASLGAANVVQAVTTLLLVRQLSSGWRLTRVRDLFALVVASSVAATLGSLVGTPLSAWVSGASWTDMAGAYVLRNAVSTATIAAVGFRLMHTRPSLSVAFQPGPRRRQAVELVCLLATTGAAYAAVFGSSTTVPVAFTVVPLAVWAGLRCTTSVVLVHSLLTAAAVVALTLDGRGPFGPVDPYGRALLAQAFVAVVFLVALSLALFRDERAALVAELSGARDEAAEQAQLLQAVLTNIGDGVTVVDADGRFVLVNRSARLLLGVDVPGATDRSGWSEHFGLFGLDGQPVPPEQLPLARALSGQDEVVDDVVVRNPEVPDGRVLDVRARRLTGEHGTTGAVAVFHDVTEERARSRRTAEARDLFAGVLASATEQAIIATDPTGAITVFNVGAERMLGWSEAEMLGLTPAQFHDGAEVLARAVELGVEPGFEVFVLAAREGRAETRRWTYLRRDGSPIQVRLTVTAMRGQDGTVVGFIGTASDLTAQLAAEAALASSEELFRTAFDSAVMGMAIAGVEDGAPGRVLTTNAALCRLLGRDQDDILAHGFTPSLSDGDLRALAAALQSMSSGEQPTVLLELAFHRPDGSTAWAMLSGAFVPGERPGRGRVIGLLEDVTARKEAEATLRHQALHDPLTSLPNRALLHDRLSHALEASTRSGLQVGLLYLDLDGFKAVNDTGGHAAGDALLQDVARRLHATVRPGDTVARLGGDEFAVVCPEVHGPDDVKAVAARILTGLQQPLTTIQGTFTVGASIGLRTGTGEHDTTEQMLFDADQAMYAAKRGGKHRVAVHGVDEQARAARAARVLPELRRALDADELVMHGQPVVDLATGRTVAVETLMRWEHPTRGLLPPSEFMEAAESSPLMLAVGRRALLESCRMAAQWHEALGPGAPAVHVNVSGRQLEDGNLGAAVDEALSRFSLPADRLVLELTETHMPTIVDSLRRDLERLRQRGVRIAIDDVGTGYSSLTRLTTLPVDILKIDVSFVAGLGQQDSCDAVVMAILGIGRAMGVSVVAEGVETPQQAALLTRYGCETAQGYLYSAPRPRAELLAHLRAESVASAAT